MNQLKKEVQTVLKTLSTRPRRRMSQNFMVSQGAIDRIVRVMQPNGHDRILEIGSGLGFLTRAILPHVRQMICVEKDKRFCMYLTKYFGAEPKIRIVETDILEFSFQELGQEPFHCVGNIPYQITSPILDVLMRERKLFKRIWLTMQKEVAMRLVAPPGSRDRSRLSVWLQMHAKIRHVWDFQKTDFFPAPKVDSSLVEIIFYSKPLYEESNREILNRCIRSGFQKRRKQLLNALFSLSDEPNKEKLKFAIEKASIEPQRRAETLSQEEWIRLGVELKNYVIMPKR